MSVSKNGFWVDEDIAAASKLVESFVKAGSVMKACRIVVLPLTSRSLEMSPTQARRVLPLSEASEGGEMHADRVAEQHPRRETSTCSTKRVCRKIEAEMREACKMAASVACFEAISGKHLTKCLARLRLF